MAVTARSQGRNSGQTAAVAIAILAIVLMLALRVLWPDSDAYSRLSWSSALLTDEGFYLHNARNQALFANPVTDDFNNRLIMPALHLAQVAVFSRFGVGVVQARSLSIVLGLLTLPVLFDALRRAFGVRPALYGTLFLGLDHVSLLYNRLALMDTPAAFVLVWAFWAFVVSCQKPGVRRLWGLFWCGILLVLAYTVRGLAGLVVPVPFVALGWEAVSERFRRMRTDALAKGPSAEERAAGEGGWRTLLPRCLPLLAGLLLALGVYIALWYWPHRDEMARSSRYYLLEQLLPENLNHLRWNIFLAWMGDTRGFSPYLFRHTPVVYLLALIGVASGGTIFRGEVAEETSRRAMIYLGGWLAAALGLFTLVNYSPSRYYVLFYPAMAALAALTLCHWQEVVVRIQALHGLRLFLGGFIAYHIVQTFCRGIWPLAEWAAIGLGILAVWKPFGWLIRPLQNQNSVLLLLLLWGGINACWLADWMLHLGWTQREADRWLAKTLPAQSVLIGDAAPGLTINNSFPAISVIDGLCNDDHPVEKYAGRPRYVVILNGETNLDWWRTRYPEVIREDERLRLFPRLAGFSVAVYRVPDHLYRREHNK